MKNLIKVFVFSCLVLATKLSFSQATNASAGNPYNANYFLGWGGTSTNPLPFRFAGSTTNVVTITPNGTATSADLMVTGNIISNNVLNLSTATAGFQIGGNSILWHNGITSNIYLGVGAGNVNATSLNTILGSNAGVSLGNTNLHDDQNVFVGYQAGNGTVGAGAISATANTFVGYRAGFTPFENTANTFIGAYAGEYNTANDNTFVGWMSGRNNSGIANAFFGSTSGLHCTGNNNTFLGTSAGTNTTTGKNNTCVGSSAGANNTTGNDNCYIGYATSSNTTNTGSRNNFLGSNAGSAEITGDDNQQIGFKSGYNNKNGFKNILIGTESGYTLGAASTESDNIFIGYKSGKLFTGGDKNILLGQNTIAKIGITNAIAIGDGADVENSNHFILGNNTQNIGIGLSSATTGPQNKLEINADPTSFTYTGTGGSGLRFRQLTSASSQIANPGTGVLSVDAYGDVILVTDQTGTGGGGNGGGLGTCGTASALTADVEIPLINGAGGVNNEWSTYFSGQTTMANSNNIAGVGIGISCGTALSGKLDVQSVTNTSTQNYTTLNAGNFLNTGTYSVAGGTDNLIGVNALCDVANSGGQSNFNIGGNFEAQGHSFQNIGTRGLAVNHSAFNYGVWGQAEKAGEKGAGVFGYANDNAFNIGVQGAADLSANSHSSIGGYFCTLNGLNTWNTFNGGALPLNSSIGVMGAVDATNNSLFQAAVLGDAGGLTWTPNTNSGTGQNKWAGFFNGNVYSSANFVISDNKVKRNITNLNQKNSMEIIRKITPASYSYKNEEYSKKLELPNGTQVGVLADNIQELLPELVKVVTMPAKQDKDGNQIESFTYKTVNYNGLIPILISAMQSQDSTIKSLQTQIQTLQTTCGYTYSAPSTLENTSTTTLSDLAIILDQNTPNPFAEQTRISYTIPESVLEAKLIFYTNNGTVIKTMPITERGAGSLLIYASNLSSGLYSYSLIADGKLIDTKKMVCMKK